MRTRIWLAGLPLSSALVLVGCEAIFGANPLAGIQPTAIPTAFTASTLPPGGAIQGRVWHDLCSVWDELEANVAAPAGCAADGRGGYRANGVQDAGEPGIGGLLVNLGPGLCPSGPTMETTTDPDGSYRFGGLTAGSYCVSLDPQAGPNSPILLPGGWTYPLGIDGIASISIALPSDELDQELNFGWDYELLPAPLGPLPGVTPTANPSHSPTPSATATLTLSSTPVYTGTPSSFPDWKAEFFANRNLSGSPALVRNDKHLAFDWGRGSPAAVLPVDNFSGRWTRRPNFSEGTYRFRLRADDGVRLFVDGKKILDEWHDSSGDVYTVDRDLDGRYTVVVEYYERTGDALFEFSWTKLPDPTSTSGPTSTPTPTFTPTPTDTNTPGPTATPTPTPTDTPEPTNTPTPTPTDTPTATPP